MTELIIIAVLCITHAFCLYAGARWVWRGMRDKPVEFAERISSQITSARNVPDEVKNAWIALVARLRQLRSQ